MLKKLFAHICVTVWVLGIASGAEEESGDVPRVVKSFDLSRDSVKDETLIKFAMKAKAERLDEISELNLDNSVVSSDALAHLVGLPIKSLSISISSVTDEGLEHLSKIPTLEVLELVGTPVTDKGMKHLRALKSLRELDVSITQVGDAGMEELAKIPTLTSLEIADTRVSDKGLAEVGKMKSLKHLRIGVVIFGSKDAIGDDGMKHIAGLDNLETLDMGYLRASENTIDILSNSKSLSSLTIPELPAAGYEDLSCIPNLRKLTFNVCELNERVAAIKKLKSLERMEFSESTISADAFNELKKALPDCSFGDPKDGWMVEDDLDLDS